MRVELASLEQCLRAQVRLLRRLLTVSREELVSASRGPVPFELSVRSQQLHRQLGRVESLRRQAETRAVGAGAGTADVRADIALGLYRCRRLNAQIDVRSRELAELQRRLSEMMGKDRRAA